MPRKLTKLESMAHHADECWGIGIPVREDVVDALDSAGLTFTRTVEEYYADEFGKDSPEYEENHDDDEFASMSVWTVEGTKLLKLIAKGIDAQELSWNPKYEGVFE